ncbi:MAG: AraC family transcriptional regulator [Rhodobacter sp.]|nr:AraC family transcriptional regulator [Rhodobacter sp.]
MTLHARPPQNCNSGLESCADPEPAVRHLREERMARHYHRASVLNGVQNVAAAVGKDPVAAMRMVGLDPALFATADERIPFDKVNELFEYCALAWNVPDFGLRLAPYQKIDVLGPISLVTKIEKDVRTAMGSMMHNLFIQSDMISAAMTEVGDVAEIYVETEEVPAGTRQYMQLALAVARNVVEDAGKSAVDLYEVTFRHDDPKLRPFAEKYFRCPVRFAAERNAIFFDRAFLDRKLDSSDAAYHPIIERYLSTARQEVIGKFSDAVRQEITRQMQLGNCTLDNVAKSVRVEPRSLQRRLNEENLSFRDLVDEWRKARAALLLRQTRLPLSEISLALGYSDQSIFSRAFQRWHGIRPLAYRKQSGGSCLCKRAYRVQLSSTQHPGAGQGRDPSSARLGKRLGGGANRPDSNSTCDRVIRQRKLNEAGVQETRGTSLFGARLLLL